MNNKLMLEASGLLDKLAKGKFPIVDRGYIKEENNDKLSWPNPHDDKLTNNYKIRARLRHETVNGRMAFFSILFHQFRHSIAKHKAAFEAIAVTVQYQMDNGHPLFAV
jgi:cytochrome oxidase assembly protein ShyY1